MFAVTYADFQRQAREMQPLMRRDGEVWSDELNAWVPAN